MTCRYPDCTEPVAAPGMSRCPTHRMRWALSQPIERAADAPVAREPEWLARARAKKYGLARPLDRSVA